MTFMFVMWKTVLSCCEKLNTSVSMPRMQLFNKHESCVFFLKETDLCTRCSRGTWSVTPNAIALEELLPTFKQGTGI